MAALRCNMTRSASEKGLGSYQFSEFDVFFSLGFDMIGSVFGAVSLIVVAMSFAGYVWTHKSASEAPAGRLPRKIRSRFAHASIQPQGQRK